MFLICAFKDAELNCVKTNILKIFWIFILCVNQILIVINMVFGKRISIYFEIIWLRWSLLYLIGKSFFTTIWYLDYHLSYIIFTFTFNGIHFSVLLYFIINLSDWRLDFIYLIISYHKYNILSRLTLFSHIF